MEREPELAVRRHAPRIWANNERNDSEDALPAGFEGNSSIQALLRSFFFFSFFFLPCRTRVRGVDILWQSSSPNKWNRECKECNYLFELGISFFQLYLYEFSEEEKDKRRTRGKEGRDRRVWLSLPIGNNHLFSICTNYRRKKRQRKGKVRRKSQ